MEETETYGQNEGQNWEVFGQMWKELKEANGWNGNEMLRYWKRNSNRKELKFLKETRKDFVK